MLQFLVKGLAISNMLIYQCQNPHKIVIWRITFKGLHHKIKITRHTKLTIEGWPWKQTNVTYIRRLNSLGSIFVTPCSHPTLGSCLLGKHLRPTARMGAAEGLEYHTSYMGIALQAHSTHKTFTCSEIG
jgi:hypothetical protein